MELTDTEKAVLIDLLAKLRETQLNAGCNDYELFDSPENLEFAEAVQEHHDYTADDVTRENGKIYLIDWMATQYLIDRIRPDEQGAQP